MEKDSWGRSNSFSQPAPVDYDCNGISGADETTGTSYEELWCDGTPHMGVGLLGDSAGAHFHLPPQWFHAADINATTCVVC